jgi:hypothetical protein
MVVISTKDFDWIEEVRQNPSLLEEPYRKLGSKERYLLDLVDGQHHAFTDSRPWYPGDERVPEHHGYIQQATTAFIKAVARSDEQSP